VINQCSTVGAAVLGCLALTGTLCAAGPTETHAATKLVRIISPTTDGLSRDDPVRVVVHVARGASFRATIGGRGITRHFARRRGGRTRVAILRRGQVPGLRYGTNYLYAKARASGGRRDIESVRFVLARRAAHFVRAPARLTGAGRIRIPMRVGGATAVVRASVNGHRVRPLSEHGRSRSILLAGDNRLRHGRNRVRVMAFDRRRGVYDVHRAVVRMRRSKPIPGAGAPRRVAHRQLVRLDGRRSRAARDGRLSYRWRIVRRPRGSTAKLRGATSVRPRLRPDVRGTYRVKLTVSERSRSRRANASALSSASDSLPIFVVPTGGGGVGLAIRTSSASRGVTLGGTHLAPQDPSAALQLVVLGRATTEVLANESYAGDATGTAALAQRVKALDSMQTAVITTPNADGNPSPFPDVGSVNNINTALKQLGGENVSTACTASGCGASFSIVGVPGLPPYTADYNINLPRTAGGSLGEMKGYLQQDSSQNFTYVSADYVPFDTHGDETSGQRAAITIGDCGVPPDVPPTVPTPIRTPCTSYDSEVLAAGSTGGFFVLVLDAGTLEMRDSGTFDTGNGSAVDMAGALQGMHALLDRYENDPTKLIFVQSIGTVRRIDGPAATAAAWRAVAGDQGDLGGLKALFDALVGGPAGSYALVAPGSKLPQPCKNECVTSEVSVASAAASGTPGRLSGVLSRNARGQFHAANATSQDKTGDSLEQVVYQDPVAWPMRDRDHASALKCVTGALQEKLGAELETPIEANYFSQGEMISPGLIATLENDLSEIDYGSARQVPGCDNPDFNSLVFADVKDQLAREFGYVSIVVGLIQGMKSTFYDDQTRANLMQTAVDDVSRAINAPHDQAKTTLDAFAIIGDLFDLIALIPGPTEIGGGLAAVGFDITSETLKDPAGDPAVDVTATADGLANALSSQIDATVNRYDTIGGMILADWGRLTRAAVNSVPGQPWALSAAGQKRVQQGVGAAGQRLAYRGLFGLRYWAYRLIGAGQPPGLNSPADYRCAKYEDDPNTPVPKPDFTGYWRPFKGYGSQGGAMSVVTDAGTDGRPVDEWWVYGNLDSKFVTGNNFYSPADLPDPTGGRTPPQSLLTEMFVTPIAPGAPPVLPSNLRFALDEFASAGMLEVTTFTGRIPGRPWTFETQCAVTDTR
jgi:hypothetical protein